MRSVYVFLILNFAVSGHTHGGQVVLPFVGGLCSPEQGLFPKYGARPLQKDKLQIAITVWLRSKIELFPRFNNPPKIMQMNLPYIAPSKIYDRLQIHK